MPLRELTLTIDADEPQRVAAFWGGLLDRPVTDDRGGLRLAGSDTQVGLRFVTGTSERIGRDRVHLHLTSTSAGDQDGVVARAVQLGATHLDVGQLPEEGHVVLADPEGNELCVIPPDSSFLAGCGFLGELACDGTRTVGRFWSEALRWPLMWDQDGETAVQSPAGGTKVAWGGPPVAPRAGRNRHRFELTTTEHLDEEVERLVSLGAVRLGGGSHDTVELTDPDGNEFTVTATA